MLDRSTSSVFECNDDGSFPIHIAVEKGHVDIVKEILKRYPDSKELLNKQGQNILHIAAKSGKNRSLLLHLATINWHPRTVMELTKFSSNSTKIQNIENKDGLRPLDIAELKLQPDYVFRERLTLMILLSTYKPRGVVWLPTSGMTLRSRSEDIGGGGDKYKDRVNILLLVATLAATVTFSAGIAVPGGFNSFAPNLGNGGNQLEARLDRDYKPSSFWCSSWLYPIHKKSGGWFRLWFDAAVLLSPFTRCFNERMMLYYDADLDDYQNAPGVNTRVPHFGSTKSLLYLDPRLRDATSYMEHLVKALEKDCGYVNDQTLLGAPYDFRYGLAASGHPSRVASQFLQDLKHLVEKTSSENKGKPVILLSHSLGGLFVLHFLNRSTPSWRRKYIKHFVALAAPWGGTVSQMKTFASGNTLGVPFVNPLLVRPQQRTSESNQWLLPSTKVFHDRTKPLVVTPRVNYTAYEMDQFLADIGFSQGVVPYKTRVLPLTEDSMTPGVPVTCIYGRGVDTPEVLVYGEGGFDEQPEIKYGDGDGTVNLASLAALEADSLQTVEIDGVSHTSILKDEVALKEIVKHISIINSGVPNVHAMNE